jgi:NitT/TauT family transport system permease protein
VSATQAAAGTVAAPEPGTDAAAAHEAAAPRTVPDRDPLRFVLTTVVPPVIVLVLVIALWLLVSYVMLTPERRFLLPPPQEVLTKGLLTWSSLGPMLTALGLTAKAAVVGFAIAVVLGSLSATVMSQARWLERSLFPYAVILQTIPILALVPLIGFSLGFTFRSRVLICIMISIFPIITTVLFGMQSVDGGLHDLFTLQRVSRWTRLRKLLIPAALPSFFTGLRTSAGLSVIGAIVGDFYFLQGQPGIGALLNSYSSQLQSDQLFAAVVLCSLLGVVAFTRVGVLSRRVIGKWHESAMDHDGRS